jgi:general secretion pathway protein D
MMSAQSSATPHTQVPQATPPIAAAVAESHVAQPEPDKRQKREAENAYLAGAKKLERDDLDAAEREFVRALNLDPENRNYAIAISVTRQHRLTELVQQAYKARQAGDQGKSETLLAEARAMDPTNPVVLEHSEPVPVSNTLVPQAAQAASGKPAPINDPDTINSPLPDRTKLLSTEPWRIQAPVLAGAIHLQPSPEAKSFDLRGASADVLRDVASAYGIRAIADDSLARKDLRFNLENVTYQQAMAALMNMTHAFSVPLDETSVLVANDDSNNRQRLERQLEETIQVPGSTTEQLNELANVVRTMFDVKQATVQASAGSILVRAPEGVLEPLNRTIEGLIESSGEVMIEVKMYEINTTRMNNTGTALPSQFTAFNVDQVATQIVNANQSLVQQAIAQGYITATTSNLDIALALIGLGLVKSSLASNLIGTIGGGFIRTGISGATNTTFNLALNSSDTRALDDVQMRIGDRQEATFREGTRYPITTSTYSTGLSTAASALSGASINGVNVADLLKQFAGGTSTTIPQVSYEDLGVTLKAKPVIEKMGRINLSLDLKIEALGGGSANGIPVLQSRQFASNLTLMDGESALMVSNVTKTETAAMTGIPGLSELPGFQVPTQQATEKDNSQLVVIVTPHVVRRRSNQVAGPRMAVHGASAN